MKKETTLARVEVGQTFTFGGVDFVKEGVESIHSDLIFCRIRNTSSFLYIANHALVEIEN